MLVDELLRRRRESNTIRQRRRRTQLKSDSNELKLQIWNLQHELDALMQHHQAHDRQVQKKRPTSTALPWKDVAMALRDHRRSSEDEYKSLRRQVRALSSLVPALHAWVTSSYLPATPAFRNPALSLKSTPLLAHPGCRQHGLDWMTKLMHANTDQLLTKYRSSSPVTTSVSSNVVVDTTSSPDGTLTFVWQFHVQVDAPIEVALPQVQRHVVAPLSGVGDVSPSWTALDPENVPSDMSYRQWRSPRDTLVNRLYREFTDRSSDGRVDRTVIVGQSIPQDEVFPSNEYMTKSMTWIVVDRIDDDRTMLRVLSTSSQAFTTAGPVSIEHEAKMRFCDVQMCPEPLKVDSLIYQYCAAAPLGTWAKYIADAVDAAVIDSVASAAELALDSPH